MNTLSMNSRENGKLHIRKIKWLKLGNLIWRVTTQVQAIKNIILIIWTKTTVFDIGLSI